MTPTNAEVRSRTAQLRELDARAVWHPFTQQSLWLADEPLVVERAKGMYFWDTDGNRYLDGVSSLWVNVHGHSHPVINAAISQQLAKLDHTTFLGLTHEPGIELAAKLADTAPEALTRVFFAGDGASAVEAAIKMAYQAQAQRGQVRPYFAHLAQAYHGDTLGAVSVGGIDLFHATYRSILLQTKTISSPGERRVGQDAADRADEVLTEARALFERHGDEICAMVVEPLVQAAAGMLTYDPAFLINLRSLCDEHGILLVVDEVATGIGRTGTMWAIEQAGIVPDLLTCGKGLTGGYLPMSAVLAQEHVYDSFLGAADSGRTFYHGHSYTANPLCAAAALANLELMAEHDTVAHAAAVGDRMGAALQPLVDHPRVKEIRRVGTMTGIEVESVGDRTGFHICQAARQHGVWIRPLGDVVVLMPPLAISFDETDELTSVVSAAIHEILD